MEQSDIRSFRLLMLGQLDIGVGSYLRVLWEQNIVLLEPVTTLTEDWKLHVVVIGTQAASVAEPACDFAIDH